MESLPTLPTLIIEYLSDKTEPVPTLQISKYVLGSKATKKMVNPALYTLQKLGKVQKIAEENGGNPRWIITK